MERALELFVELVESFESLMVERQSMKLSESGALEAFADGVVVWRAGRDEVVLDVEFGDVVLECSAGELWPVVAEHTTQLDTDRVQSLCDVVDEAEGLVCGLVTDEQLADHPAGGGVDRGQLPDGEDAF